MRDRGLCTVVLDNGLSIPEPWKPGGFSGLPLDKIIEVVFEDDDGKIYAVKIDRTIHPTIRPIFVRRQSASLSLAHGETSLGTVAVGLGWQATVNGKNVSSYTWLLQDGVVMITDRHLREFY